MFVNTRLLSPVILEGVTMATPGSYEHFDWYTEERRRCLEGYQAGDIKITGYHYWYLNYWKIRRADGESGKRLMAPRFLDMDHEFFWEMDAAIKAKEDLLAFKARQKGFSYKSSSIAACDYTFIPDSYTIICSGDAEFSEHTFKMAKTGLAGIADTEFYKNAYIDNRNLLHSGYEIIDELGRESVQGYNSVIHRITGSTPQCNIGKSASKVIYEEVGKFPNIIATKGYTDPGLEQQGVKTGFQLLIGTGGEENESIEEVEKMMYNPKIYGLRSYENKWSDVDFLELEGGLKDTRRVAYFIPAWKFLVVDEDGNSLKEESIAEIHRRREEKSGSKDALLKEKTQFPLTIEEGLMTPDGNVFDVEKLREVLIHVMRYQELTDQTRTGFIDWTYDKLGNRNGAEWRDDPEGPFIMTEPPYRQDIGPDGGEGVVPPDLYIAATDSYDRDKTASVNGSFGCCKIYKLFNKDLGDATMELPVCSLTARPATAKEFYEMTAKLCVFYGNAVNLIEYSNLLIFEWYHNNGYTHLLKERPQIAYAGVINSQVQNRYGIDPQVKPYAIQAAADWVSENYMKLRDIQFIKRLIKYKNDPKYNCDETMAFAWLITHRNDVRAKYDATPEVDLDSRWGFMPRYVVKGNRIVMLD